MKSRKSLIFWCAILGLIVIMTVFSSLFSTYGPNEMNLDKVYAAPGERSSIRNGSSWS